MSYAASHHEENIRYARRYNGERFSELEFEEQCSVRSLAYGGYMVYDGPYCRLAPKYAEPENNS